MGTTKGKQSVALLAIAGLLVVAGSAQQAYAQYGVEGSSIGATSEEQLEKCKDYDISRTECTDNTILAKERWIYAEQNPGTGSGTSMIATSDGQTWIFIGVLATIFDGVAAAFFVRGRGSYAPS